MFQRWFMLFFLGHFYSHRIVHGLMSSEKHRMLFHVSCPVWAQSWVTFLGQFWLSVYQVRIDPGKWIKAGGMDRLLAVPLGQTLPSPDLHSSMLHSSPFSSSLPCSAHLPTRCFGLLACLEAAPALYLHWHPGYATCHFATLVSLS